MSGMNCRVSLFGFLVGFASLAPLSHAHFRLLEPAASLEQNNLGDPQKLGPCGGTTANPGSPTNATTQVRGGSKLYIKVQETVFHPGHYRVAIAPSAAQLPPDADAATRETERGPWSVSAPIQSSPKLPVLADGLFAHTAKTAEAFGTDVEIPNINCEKCMLQITQFMAEHGFNKDGGYYYHHCATVQITADPAKPVLKDWSGAPSAPSR